MSSQPSVQPSARVPAVQIRPTSQQQQQQKALPAQPGQSQAVQYAQQAQSAQQVQQQYQQQQNSTQPVQQQYAQQHNGTQQYTQQTQPVQQVQHTQTVQHTQPAKVHTEAVHFSPQTHQFQQVPGTYAQNGSSTTQTTQRSFAETPAINNIGSARHNENPVSSTTTQRSDLPHSPDISNIAQARHTDNPRPSSGIPRTNSTGKTPMISWATVGALLLLGLAIFAKDPLNKRTSVKHAHDTKHVHKGKTTQVAKSAVKETPVDKEVWKEVSVVRLPDAGWSGDRPFDWPHAKRLVVFGDETVSSAAGNAHGDPNGLETHKGLRWTDYLYKSFMDDGASYHNLAGVGASAADIDAQVKAFQSTIAVQGRNFKGDDTLFIIGTGEAGVKPLDGSAPKARAVTAEVNELVRRASALYDVGARSFLFLTLREAGQHAKARKHFNAELSSALDKWRKTHKDANVLVFSYSEWFDALRSQPDLFGITECEADLEPNTESARLGFCVDTFGDETWPVDRLLSHAVNGYLVHHSRTGKEDAKTAQKSGKAKVKGKAY